MRAHFKEILYNQVCTTSLLVGFPDSGVCFSKVLNGKFCEEFSKISADLEKEGSENPLNELYAKMEASELGQAELRVRATPV